MSADAPPPLTRDSTANEIDTFIRARLKTTASAWVPANVKPGALLPFPPDIPGLVETWAWFLGFFGMMPADFHEEVFGRFGLWLARQSSPTLIAKNARRQLDRYPSMGLEKAIMNRCRFQLRKIASRLLDQQRVERTLSRERQERFLTLFKRECAKRRVNPGDLLSGGHKPPSGGEDGGEDLEDVVAEETDDGRPDVEPDPT